MKLKPALIPACILCLSAQPGYSANPLNLVRQLTNRQSAAAPAKSPLQAIVPRDKWAVVVAVGKYRDPAVKPVKWAVNNGTDMANVLRDASAGRFAADHVITLMDKGATKTAIEGMLSEQWLYKKALPEDLIALYISGRAKVSPDRTDVLFLPFDATAQAKIEETVSLRKVFQEIRRRTQSRFAIAFLDLSLIEPESESTAPFNLQQLADDTGISIMSASLPGLPSNEGGSVPGSVFSHYLSQGLVAFGGSLPLVTVFEFVSKNVEHDVQAQLGKTQKPVLAIAGKGVDLSGMQVGIPVKSSLPEKSIAFGYKEDELSTTRPDLLAGGKPKLIARSRPEPAKAPDPPAPPRVEKVGDVDFGSYMSKMKRHIQTKWVPPKGMEERKVVAVFTIMKDGKIIDPTLVESSGVDSVDASAMAALKLASPLEPLPEGSPEYVQIRYKFDYKVHKE